MVGTASIKGFDQDNYLENNELAVDAMKRNNAGEALPANRFPKEMYAEYKDKKEKKQPDLFNAGGTWTVSSACAAVLRQFDLGDGNLYPVKLFQHDRATPVEGEYYCLNFGNQKAAVLTDQSPNIDRPYENQEVYQPPLVMKDKDIAVSAIALDGPDIWIDTKMRRAFFVSDPLAQALRAAKVSRPFKLRECIVL